MLFFTINIRIIERLEVRSQTIYALLTGWCAKMQFFYDMSKGADDRHAFTAQELDAFVEPTEVQDILAAGAGPDFVGRLGDIRRLNPR